MNWNEFWWMFAGILFGWLTITISVLLYMFVEDYFYAKFIKEK